MTFTVRQESPDQPEIHALITALDQTLDSQYEGFCNYRLNVAQLMIPEIRFFVARDDRTQQAVGIGAVRFHDDFAEVKRMYSLPSYRGQGIGEAILQRVLATIEEAGESVVRLETGDKLAAAVGLYRKHGFEVIPAFGEYQATADTSLCMEKRL